jgi:chromosome segregation ATPase
MKKYLIAGLTLAMVSCVSSKRLKTAEERYNQLEKKLEMAYARIDSCETQNAALTVNLEKSRADNLLAVQKHEALVHEIDLRAEQLKAAEENSAFVKTTNDELTKRVADLHNSNNVNAEIIKKMLEELESKNLKVLNLSLALQKQDSLNIHLVKRTKQNISDKKLKKSLEKLGFVFY